MQKVTAKKDKLAVVYGTLKFFGKLMMIWPIDNSMKWYNRILLELFWWILIVNGTALIAGIIIGTYYFYKEVTTFTTLLFIVFEITVISESIYTSIYCKIQRQHLKVCRHPIHSDSISKLKFQLYVFLLILSISNDFFH